MRHMLWATSIAALLAVTGTALPTQAETAPAGKNKAAAKQPAEKATKSALFGEYTTMAKELNLTPEQISKLEAIAAEHKKASSAWSASNKEALAQASADSKSADEATKKAGKEKSAALRKEAAEASKSYTDKALALLTTEQRSQYDAAKLAAISERSFKRSKIEFTPEQTAKIKSLAAEALKGVDTNDAKALGAASSKLTSQIKESVLTSEQASQIPAAAAKPAAKAGSATKDAPKAKPAAKKANKAEAAEDEDAEDM